MNNNNNNIKFSGKINQNKHFINRQIRAAKVRVIFEAVNEIMTLNEALTYAADRDLDLVQFGTGEIPTCRIIDYSKYKYQEEKKKKQEASNKHTLKEIQLRPSISQNDLQVKTKQILGFLEKGNDVRIRVKLRGREKANADRHSMFLVEFANSFSESAKVEGKIGSDGIPVGWVLTLKPLKTAPKTQ